MIERRRNSFFAFPPRVGDAMSNGLNRSDRLSGDEVVDLAHVVSGLSRAGLPLGPGLRALAEEMPSHRLGRAFEEVATQLDQGKSLEDVLGDEQQSPRFPSHLRGLVAAGLRTGRLGTILDDYVRYEQTGAELRRNFWIGLSYPFLLIVGMTVLTLFVSGVIVRDLSAIYKDFGVDLPRATVSIIGASEVMRKNQETIVVMMLVPLLAFVVIVASRYVVGERSSRGFVSRIPIFGRVSKWTSWAEFFHLLGLLVQSEVPLGEALTLAGGGIRDPYIQLRAEQLAHQAAQGHSLSEAVRSVGALPSGLPALLHWAESNNSLAESLHLIAANFENRARAYSSMSISLIAIFIVSTVVISVGILIAALLIPMIMLISKLSG